MGADREVTMVLDEATSALLAEMAKSGAKSLTEMTPQEAREFVAGLRDQYGPGPTLARVEDARVRSIGGSFPVRILVPDGRVDGVIVYYHGGGWVIGSVDDFETLGRHLAERTKCAVVLVGYRLAPEYRYPTAAEDAWAALQWAESHLDDIAGRRVPLIVAGDSAGGNLAAVVAQRALARGGPALALQVLVYPVTECDFDTLTYTDPSNQLMLTREAMIWFWDQYAPDELARTHVDASPLRAGTLAGLPPAVIITAEHDVLRDEGELYATRLLKFGVPVEHRRFEGQMHGFFTMINVLPGSAAAMDYVVQAVQPYLAKEHQSV
jgi:acetyl esterase